MTAVEKSSLDHLTVAKSSASGSAEKFCEQAVAWAEEHLFERRSIVHEHELWRHALERARGQDVSLADLQSVTQQRGYVAFQRSSGKVSTREHLLREWEIVEIAKTGFGNCHPLAWNRAVQSQLDAEQREALEELLGNINLVSTLSRWRRHGQEFRIARAGRTNLGRRARRGRPRAATPAGAGFGARRISVTHDRGQFSGKT